MATADVTVMGAGVFGLSVAYACLLRGAHVQVIDPSGVGAGASGGIVGALAPHVPENWNAKKEFQLESLLMAETYWARVSETSKLPTGYQRSGRLQPLADAKAVIFAQARAISAVDLWQGKAIWEVIPASENGTWVPPSPTGLVVRDTLSALIHPRMAVSSLAGAIRSLGGKISRISVPQGKIVWATGWTGLAEGIKRPIGNGVKGQALLLEYPAQGLPQLFADTLHIVPHMDGTVAIGSTSENVFDDPSSTDAQLDEIHKRAVRAFPVLSGAPVKQRWAGVRPRARIPAPVLGRHPLREGDFIANGGFKIGFGMAPLVGEVMADLLLSNLDRIPADFDPIRAL